jgi:two-component system, chemotaxis family, protein-glutamate methylesterase/glutaminase
LIRVLVADDSAFTRKVLVEMLRSSPHIEVVGTAANGSDALNQVATLRPDVVTVDLNMPVMDGAEFLRVQFKRGPVRCIVLSSAAENEPLALQALESGALEFLRKPTAIMDERLRELSAELVRAVTAVAAVPLHKLSEYVRPVAPGPVQKVPGLAMRGAVVMALSTGGPRHLRQLCCEWTRPLPLAMAAVVHMPPGFTGPFAERLNQMGAMEVLEANDGMVMQPGRLILGRAGRHLSFARTAQGEVAVQLSIGGQDLHCPSADVLFESAASLYQEQLLGLVLTGMGNDGTAGAAWIKAQGGTVWAEHEETCVVYGMPRAVSEAGLADLVVPLPELSGRLYRWAERR